MLIPSVAISEPSIWRTSYSHYFISFYRGHCSFLWGTSCRKVDMPHKKIGLALIAKNPTMFGSQFVKLTDVLGFLWIYPPNPSLPFHTVHSGWMEYFICFNLSPAPLKFHHKIWWYNTYMLIPSWAISEPSIWKTSYSHYFKSFLSGPLFLFMRRRF